MRRIVPAFAAGLALVVPSLAIAAGDVLDDAPPAASAPSEPALAPANVSPVASLTATLDGGEVVLDASKSTDDDGRIVLYEWDLDGDGVFEDKTLEAIMRTTYPPGTTVAPNVRVTDDAGAGGEANVSVTVPAAPEPEPAAEPEPAEPKPAKAPEPDSAPDAADPEAAPAPPEPQRADAEPVAKEDPPVIAAADGSVTISDFDFGPATVNVNVGDSVTWVNQGPSIHTATANGGEFDSGNLDDGQSFSHTFDQAGTYAYICTPHPFMTGRVVVSAAGGGSGGSGSGGGSGGGGDDAGSSGSSGSGTTGDDTAGTTDSGATGGLAQTGADMFLWIGMGLAMLGFGTALRLRGSLVA